MMIPLLLFFCCSLACQGLTESECLGGSTPSRTCVFCSSPSSSTCISLPDSTSCDEALNSCSQDALSATCKSCQGDCATNRGSSTMFRSLAIFSTLAVSFLHSSRSKGVVPLLAIVFLAMVAPSHAAWVFVDESVATPVGSLPIKTYVPAMGVPWNHWSKRSVLQVPVVESFEANVTIVNNYATSVITSLVKNPGEEPQLVEFSLNIAQTAFVSGLTVVIGDARYVGKVVPKKEAEEMFADAQARGQTAGLLKSRGTREFAVSLNAAAGASARFEVRFEELLNRRLGRYAYDLNVNPGNVVPSLTVRIDVWHESTITSLDWSHVDAFRDGQASTTSTDEKKRVVLQYIPTVETQRKTGNFGLAEDISVEYTVGMPASPGSLMVTNNHFVHQFAVPDWIEPSTLSIVFVIDRSGSMEGFKMAQAIQSLQNVLRDLREGDRFGIISFSDDPTPFKSTMVSATSANKDRAISFAADIRAGGGTYMGRALSDGKNLLMGRASIAPSPDTPLMVLLTDGQPSMMSDQELRLFTRKLTQGGGFPLYTLGFGEGVNMRLLQDLAIDSGATARQIFSGMDATDQLSDFYKEIATPLVSNVEVRYEPAVEDLSATSFGTMFKGTEVVVAGRVADANATMLTATVTGVTKCGCSIQWQRRFSLAPTTQVDAEKIWAFVTINDLIVRARREEGKILAGADDKTNEAMEESIRLAIKYQFVTPYTSFIVVVDEQKDEAKEKEHTEDLSMTSSTPPGTFASVDPVDPIGSPNSPAVFGGSRGNFESADASCSTGLSVVLALFYASILFQQC